MSERFIAYYRVSTSKQGAKGLGMDAQKSAVMQYLNSRQGELIGEFIEVESGGKNTRPQLAEALHQCKLTGSTLVIAKLDRLARNLHFVTGLQEAKVPFVCCDMPEANELTIHVIAAVAQAERKAISVRTTAALAEIKAKLARGEPHISRSSGKPVTRLGSTNGFTVTRNDLGRLKRSENAFEFAKRVRPTIMSLKDGGLTLQAIANQLNTLRVLTSQGKTWTPMAVKRVMDRSSCG